MEISLWGPFVESTDLPQSTADLRTRLVTLIKNYPQFTFDELDKICHVLDVAWEIHEKQATRGDGPYIDHLLRVAITICQTFRTYP